MNHRELVDKTSKTTNEVLSSSTASLAAKWHSFTFRNIVIYQAADSPNPRRYYVSPPNDTVTFQEASTNCFEKHMVLANVEDASEERQLLRELDEYHVDVSNNPQPEFWIGGTNQGSSNGEFFWLNSPIAMDYTNWAKGAPSGNKCVKLAFSLYHSEWVDEECTEKYRYICKEPLREQFRKVFGAIKDVADDGSGQVKNVTELIAEKLQKNGNFTAEQVGNVMNLLKEVFANTGSETVSDAQDAVSLPTNDTNASVGEVTEQPSPEQLEEEPHPSPEQLEEEPDETDEPDDEPNWATRSLLNPSLLDASNKDELKPQDTTNNAAVTWIKDKLKKSDTLTDEELNTADPIIKEMVVKDRIGASGKEIHDWMKTNLRALTKKLGQSQNWSRVKIKDVAHKADEVLEKETEPSDDGKEKEETDTESEMA